MDVYACSHGPAYVCAWGADVSLELLLASARCVSATPRPMASPSKIAKTTELMTKHMCASGASFFCTCVSLVRCVR